VHNICNRGRHGKGIQLEITHPLRRSAQASDVVEAVREALAEILSMNLSGENGDAPSL
jgi:phage replication-related protein YjqB (UPF0714/DUF867 family)